LSSPDVAVVPLVVGTSIFRVSWRAAFASSLACSAGVAALLALEAHLGLELPLDRLLLLSLYLLAATAVALFGVRRARQMFERVGQTAQNAERARSSVLSLLEDHHDLRSILCDLQLQAERLGEDLTKGSESTIPLLRAIEELSRASGRSRERALEALAGMERPSPCRLDDAVTAAARLVAARHPEVAVTVDPSGTAQLVPFPGGSQGLERLIVQLMINAVEGNGTTGARSVTIRRVPGPAGLVELAIEDDGPGFSESLTSSAGRERGTSTKPGSAGLGLWLCRGALRTVGGELSVTNLAPRGARLQITLPLLAGRLGSDGDGGKLKQ
jgi:signal transduction histidine kinase